MKKRLKNIIALAITGAMVLSFAGCSNKKDDKVEDAMSKDTLILGFDDTFVPMGFKDDNGEYTGFDIDIAKEVSKRIGKEIKFQPIEWSMKETELNSGNIDFIWNGYSVSKERKEKVNFSEAYLNNTMIIITLADSPINSKADLAGAKVAAQSESTAVTAIEKEPEVLKTFADGKVITYGTNTEALQDLEAGRIDAVVADEILAKYYISKKNADDYKVLEDNFGDEVYAVGVRKSDKELLEALNKAFNEIKDDGTGKTISEKWFGEDLFMK